MRTKNHNHMMYGSWDPDKIFLSFWAIFCPFTSPPHNDPEYQNFEKNEKNGWLEILSFYTYMCTINEDHTIHGSWNRRCDRQKFLTFWAIFCLFSPLTTWQTKILTLKKTPGEIIILHICTINDNHEIYGSWDKEYDWHAFLSFWTVFCPSTHLWAQKIKIFLKMEKTPEDIIILRTQMTVIWWMVLQIRSVMDRIFCHFGPFFALSPL